MIKKILLGLLGIIVMLIIVGFFLPAKLEMSKSIVVNAPAEYAFEEVNNLENWPKWSYWSSIDPEMKMDFGPTRTGAGAFYNWKGPKTEAGKLTILESDFNSFVTAEVNVQGMSRGMGKYSFEPEGENTKVTMSFSSEFGMNPLDRWFGTIFMKSEMEKSFDHGLARIKEIAEAKPKFSIPITVETVSPVTYVGLSHSMRHDDPQAVSAQMGKMYAEIFTALSKAKVPIASRPFCMYPKFTEESMDFIAGWPVVAGSKVPAKYKVAEIAGGKVVKGVHTGDYAMLGESHEQINRFIEFRKLEMNGAPWEVYVTDWDVEKDASKLVTEIYYPIK